MRNRRLREYRSKIVPLASIVLKTYNNRFPTGYPRIPFFLETPNLKSKRNIYFDLRIFQIQKQICRIFQPVKSLDLKAAAQIVVRLYELCRLTSNGTTKSIKYWVIRSVPKFTANMYRTLANMKQALKQMQYIFAVYFGTLSTIFIPRVHFELSIAASSLKIQIPCKFISIEQL